MEKKLLWVVIIAIVAIGGYLVFKHNTPVVKNSVSTNSYQTPMPNNSNKSVSELMQSGDSYKCSWSQSMNGNSTDFTAYIHGENVRAESNIKSPYMSMSSTFLRADGYIYTWTSQDPKKGTKTKEVAPNSNPGAPTPEASITMAFHSLIDGMNRAPGYSCQRWSADTSLLTPPANITFMSTSR